MKKLTIRQQEILSFIENYEQQNGYWPSIREIQEKFDFKSTNSVMGHLRALEKKNFIQRIPGQARTFRINRSNIIDMPNIPEGTTEVVNIPVMGSIAAGYPDRVESAGEVDQLQVDMQTTANFGRYRNFALKVRGESMINAEIYDGDHVIVEPREPRDGDIVAALIDGETTLKRYIHKFGEPPYLKAENDLYPELYPVNELCVQGVAKAVVRNL